MGYAHNDRHRVGPWGVYVAPAGACVAAYVAYPPL
jgi:hypothetical protein